MPDLLLGLFVLRLRLSYLVATPPWAPDMCWCRVYLYGTTMPYFWHCSIFLFLIVHVFLHLTTVTMLKHSDMQHPCMVAPALELCHWTWFQSAEPIRFQAHSFIGQPANQLLLKASNWRPRHHILSSNPVCELRLIYPRWTLNRLHPWSLCPRLLIDKRRASFQDWQARPWQCRRRQLFPLRSQLLRHHWVRPLRRRFYIRLPSRTPTLRDP